MDLVLRAVAEPSRRAILDELSLGERAAGDLLGLFDFSQPALSRHLRVLREAGLVAVRPEGRKRIYALQADGLRSVAEWVAHYERFWNQRLDRLAGVLDRMAIVDEKEGGTRP